MSQEIIIVIALVVLGLAIALILRELRRKPVVVPLANRRASAAPPPQIIPSAVQDPADDPDLDVTRVGSSLALMGALPRLGSDDIDIEEAASGSTAITTFEDGADVDEPTGPIDLFLLSAAAQSDVGKRRKRNEDSYLLDDDRSVFVVADGMGGYAGGDIASRLATETMATFLREETNSPIIGRPDRPRVANELVAAIQAANTAIFNHAQRSPELHGMGTTVVAATFTKKKRRGYIAYAGDSRCYRLRAGKLKLLTSDHTFAARGVEGPLGNQIRRAVGVKPSIKVDLIVDSPRAGDVYILCSDGLNKMVGDDELEKLVDRHRDDLPSCARTLVDRANQAGGRDNVTVVVVGIRDSDKRTQVSSRAALTS